MYLVFFDPDPLTPHPSILFCDCYVQARAVLRLCEGLCNSFKKQQRQIVGLPGIRLLSPSPHLSIFFIQTKVTSSCLISEESSLLLAMVLAERQVHYLQPSLWLFGARFTDPYLVRFTREFHLVLMAADLPFDCLFQGKVPRGEP